MFADTTLVLLIASNAVWVANADSLEAVSEALSQCLEIQVEAAGVSAATASGLCRCSSQDSCNDWVKTSQSHGFLGVLPGEWFKALEPTHPCMLSIVEALVQRIHLTFYAESTTCHGFMSFGNWQKMGLPHYNMGPLCLCLGQSES